MMNADLSHGLQWAKVTIIAKRDSLSSAKLSRSCRDSEISKLEQLLIVTRAFSLVKFALFFWAKSLIESFEEFGFVTWKNALGDT